jgi:hypothetical protein
MIGACHAQLLLVEIGVLLIFCPGRPQTSQSLPSRYYRCEAPGQASASNFQHNKKGLKISVLLRKNGTHCSKNKPIVWMVWEPGMRFDETDISWK